jgi:hypothetical protein
MVRKEVKDSIFIRSEDLQFENDKLTDRRSITVLSFEIRSSLPRCKEYSGDMVGKEVKGCQC